MVVVFTPLLDFVSGLVQGSEPVLVQTFVPELVDRYNRFQLTVWQHSRRSVTLAVQFPSNKKGPPLRIALRG